jgi:flagella basal body P-ring formation protein FlgA
MTQTNSNSRLLRRAAAGALVSMVVAVLGHPVSALGITCVRVYDQAEVQADQIRLGGIARIDGGDAAFVRKLEGVFLGRSPLPGKTRTLDAATLISRLRQGGVDPDQLDLQIPPEVVLRREAITIDRDRIEQIVREFLQQQGAGKPSAAIWIKDIRVSETVQLPKGQLTTQVSVPKNSELAGSVPLQVIFTVEPDFERRVWVTASLEQRVNVVVARRPLGRFKPIEADDIEMKALDLAGLPADRIDDPEVAIGKRTRRAVDSGTVLRPDLLEFPPLIKRGDRVRIIAESSGLRISAFGQAKQKGAQGEMIPVVNLDSNKVIHARVVDSQTVRIEF